MNETIEKLTAQHRDALAALAGRFGYAFRALPLLQRAMIHSSYAFEQGSGAAIDNERLEYLGDAVLDLAVGHLLYATYPEMREGELTRLRAALVNESHLAVMAREFDLGAHLLLGRGEEASAGREKPSILSSAYEAVIGAIYEDGGFAAAMECVRNHFTPWLETRRQSLLQADAKSALQELLQERYAEAPLYVLDEAAGPDHAKQFTVSVRFRDQVLGRGTAKNKKEAEQQAAAVALQDRARLDTLG
ncbi:MAG: ribonuclease III [Thermodesulfobacteriota bacterium]